MDKNKTLLAQKAQAAILGSDDPDDSIGVSGLVHYATTTSSAILDKQTAIHSRTSLVPPITDILKSPGSQKSGTSTPNIGQLDTMLRTTERNFQDAMAAIMKLDDKVNANIAKVEYTIPKLTDASNVDRMLSDLRS